MEPIMENTKIATIKANSPEEPFVGRGLKNRNASECIRHVLNPNGNAPGRFRNVTEGDMEKAGIRGAERLLALFGVND